jgi:four helix bundle protein
MKVKSYRELIAWQKAMDLVVLVYRATAQFPREEVYGLTAQVRKASVSVPSNIAEGQGRFTTNEFLHFLSVATGSRNEAETQILIAERLGYLDNHQCEQILSLSAEVGRVVSGLVNSLSVPPPTCPGPTTLTTSH